MLQGDALASALGAPGRRSVLLEESGPHRMINGTIATGALCRQAELAQWAHHQQLVRCNFRSVETAPHSACAHDGTVRSGNLATRPSCSLGAMPLHPEAVSAFR